MNFLYVLFIFYFLFLVMHFVVSFIWGFIYVLQNKILHSRLEALHIQLAEKDRHSAGMPSGSTGTDTLGDSGLQNIVNYL